MRCSSHDFFSCRVVFFVVNYSRKNGVFSSISFFRALGFFSSVAGAGCTGGGTGFCSGRGGASAGFVEAGAEMAGAAILGDFTGFPAAEAGVGSTTPDVSAGSFTGTAGAGGAAAGFSSEGRDAGFFLPAVFFVADRFALRFGAGSAAGRDC